MIQEKPSPTIEDYLQAIYNLADDGDSVVSARLARRMGVTPPSAWAAVRRMLRDGLVELDTKKAISLTHKGKDWAESTVRRHRLAERFLTDILGLGWVEVHEEAHRFEHAISPRLEERIFSILNNPTTCPHGSPIPGSTTSVPGNLKPMDTLQPGDAATIGIVSEELEVDSALLHYLERGQIMPGRNIRVIEKAGGVIIVEVEQGPVPIGLDVAAKILVRPE